MNPPTTNSCGQWSPILARVTWTTPTKITAYLIEKKAPSLWVMPVPIFVLRCGAPGAMIYSYLNAMIGSTFNALRAGI